MDPEIKKILKSLLIKYPTFGQVLANLNIVALDSVGTACTDSKTIYYSPTFLQDLNENQKKFLFAHEICHIILNHIFRSEGKDKRLWNIATDAIINANLISEGLEMIEDGVYIEDALKYNAEELYEKLLEKQKEEQEEKQNQEQKQEQEQEQEQKDEKKDNHVEDSSSKKNSGNGEAKQKNGEEMEDSRDTSNKSQESKGKSVGRVKVSELSDKKCSHSMWDEAVKKARYSGKKQDDISEQDLFEENKREKEKKLEELKRRLAGITCRLSDNSLGQDGVGKAQKELDWKQILLSGLIKGEYDWKHSKQVKNGVLPYELKKETPIPSTEVMIDASGSVSLSLVRAFLRQIKPLVKKTKLKVGLFNDVFWGLKDIRSEKDIEHFEIPSEVTDSEYSYTEDWDLAVRSFSRGKYINKIVFTDGWPCPGHFPEEDLKNEKVIWIVYGNDNFKPCCGKVIYLTEEQILDQNIETGYDYD